MEQEHHGARESAGPAAGARIVINRILCPVDFSEFSRRAVRHAARIAECYESTVDLLHVVASVAPPAVPADTPPQIGRFRFAGTLAWWAWLLVHIFFLIGFRNRFVVLFEWAWAYWSYQRAARIILDES